jgi:hypothetical protein
MEILSSRVVLRPQDLEHSLRFYEDTLELAVYREWGAGKTRGDLGIRYGRCVLAARDAFHLRQCLHLPFSPENRLLVVGFS